MATESTRSEKRKTSRAKDTHEFWERYTGKKLTNREASEMQSNIEGLMALLAQWDRVDCAVARPRKNHDAPKD